jgi:hypothetical protein
MPKKFGQKAITANLVMEMVLLTCSTFWLFKR